jgi:hypothetical protein
MHAALPINGTMPPPSAAPAQRASQRDWPTLLFVLFGALFGMTVSQEYTGEQSSLRFVLYVGPAAAVALLRPVELVEALRDKAFLLMLLLALGGGWHFFLGDTRAALTVGLFALMLTWHNARPVRLVVNDISRAYVAMVAVGAAVWLFTESNKWGLIPGTTATAFGIWRVSFFPNIAISAFFSLAVLILLTRDGWRQAMTNAVFWLSLYFVIFSFVRTAIICLALYVLMYTLYRLPRWRLGYFVPSLVVGIGANLFIAYSATIFLALQDLPLISRLFLRGESGLSEYEIYEQFFRPWLWSQQFNQFWTSSYLMGWGSTDFVSLVTDRLQVSIEAGDSVSLPTRMLSQFGLAGLLFSAYLIVALRQTARRRDLWACAVWPVTIIALMQWGSLFHPADAFGLLFMLILAKGWSGFAGRADFGSFSRSRA